jgi:hypothetical protein
VIRTQALELAGLWASSPCLTFCLVSHKLAECPRALPACREPSSAAELGEPRLHIGIGCELAFDRILQSAVDAFELRLGRLIDDIFEAGVDVERDLGKLVLSIRRPTLDPLQRLVEQLGFHGGTLPEVARSAAIMRNRSMVNFLALFVSALGYSCGRRNG